MTLLAFLTTGANAPFTVALIVTVAFVLLSLSGVLGLLTGSAHDDDHDHDADDGDDADDDGDDDHEHEGDKGFSLGFGLPLTLAWQTFAVVFGITGLIVNARWIEIGRPPLSTLAYALPISALSGFVVLAALSRVLRPILSSKETEATKRSALVGRVGTVISSHVSQSFGEVRLDDAKGNVVRVLVKLADGARSPREREQVVVVGYEDEQLLVAPLEDDPPDAKSAAH